MTPCSWVWGTVSLVGWVDISMRAMGAALGWPIEPYAKGTYRLALPFLARNVLRLHETIFWQEGDGFGATMRLDLERLLADDFLSAGPARVR